MDMNMEIKAYMKMGEHSYQTPTGYSYRCALTRRRSWVQIPAGPPPHNITTYIHDIQVLMNPTTLISSNHTPHPKILTTQGKRDDNYSRL